jgi:hypothetical protein
VVARAHGGDLLGSAVGPAPLLYVKLPEAHCRRLFVGSYEIVIADWKPFFGTLIDHHLWLRTAHVTEFDLVDSLRR